jgi:hypothetical protein
MMRWVYVSERWPPTGLLSSEISGMYCRVLNLISTDVSEVRAALTKRALMMETARTSETSVDIQLRTRQYIPEDSELHTRRRENLNSDNRSIVHHPGDTWEWRAMVKIPAWLVHQSYLAVLPAESSGASRNNGRRSENFACQYLRYLKGPLTCREILHHGTSGFTSHSMEGVLRIFIALKNPLLWPGSNPRPLGPVASTLTTSPPRPQFFSRRRHFLASVKISRRYGCGLYASNRKVETANTRTTV